MGLHSGVGWGNVIKPANKFYEKKKISVKSHEEGKPRLRGAKMGQKHLFWS